MATEPRFRHGAGRLCLDFVRTLRYRGRPDAVEELADPAALAAWVEQFGPCDPAPGRLPDRRSLGEARRLREAIHALLHAALGVAGPAPATARSRVNRAAALPPPAPSLGTSGRLRWYADDPVAATLVLVARDALDLVTSDALHRVRACANPGCRILFLDGSRPGTRRWCSMGTCGNQAKKGRLPAG
jgi:predicted RNA-binding Zn ribbon-like protein